MVCSVAREKTIKWTPKTMPQAIATQCAQKTCGVTKRLTTNAPARPAAITMKCNVSHLR
jgi:hypothetical protein